MPFTSRINEICILGRKRRLYTIDNYLGRHANVYNQSSYKYGFFN